MTESINNRYRIVRQLGKGGMGTVYLVEDSLQDNRPLALKVIRSSVALAGAPAASSRNLAQFKYEFAALGQLHHPNLVTVYDFDLIADSQDYFFTMEYVPGDDLPQVGGLRQFKNTEDYQWLYGIIIQICRALQYIHSRGFIHYDVKPRNIRLTPEGQVKLMDFGLIGQARGHGQLKVRGTPDYIAPEVIRGAAVDHRADLYSLGVALYEIVTHRLPFIGDTTSSMQVFQRHMETTPEPPRHFVSDIPDKLQALILDLLAKDPLQRPSNANAVIQTINDFSGLNFPLETKETKQGYIQSGHFVGRDVEMARLQGWLMRMMQGQGRLLLIAGVTGVGKTRLARELRLRAQLQRALVCEGAGQEDAHVPYHPWAAVLSQMVSYARANPKGEALLKSHGAALVKLLPQLAERIGVPASTSGVDDKRNLMEITTRFLLASERPLLIILDDLQYADPGTIELLDYVGQRAGQGRILICGIYQDGDLTSEHPLQLVLRRATEETTEANSAADTEGNTAYDLLRLNPLTEADTAEFVKSMLGVKELPPGLLPRLMSETGGNALFIESVMRSLVDEDLLHYDGETWRIQVTHLTRLPLSIRDAAQRRLKRLEPETLTLLQWAATIGLQPDLDLLMEVTGYSPERLFAVIERALTHHVLTRVTQTGAMAYRFSDDQTRQVIYATLTPEERVEHHQNIGEMIQALYPESDMAEALAWHFERAGQLGLALHYSHRAADKARRVFANETARQHYSHALNFLKTMPPNAQLEYDLLAGREECCGRLGDRRAQEADLAEMGRLAYEMSDIARQIDVAMRQNEVSRVLGNNTEALRAAEVAYALAQQVGDQKLEADALTSLGEIWFSLGDFASGLECHQKALTRYRTLASVSGEAASLRWLGQGERRLGNVAQAQEFFKQSLALYRQLNDRAGESHLLNALGTTVSDYVEAIHYHEQALAIRQALGDRDRQAQSLNNLAVINTSLGVYAQARDYIKQAVQLQREMGGRTSLSFFLETLGRVQLHLGDYAQAQMTFEEGRTLAIKTNQRLNESLYSMMLGRLALVRGQASEACELLQQASDMQREMGVISDLASTLTWLGAAQLALGHWEAADATTAEAVELMQKSGGNAGDYPPQDVWWVRYEVLRAAPGQSEGLSSIAREALQAAHTTMLNGIATLSDDNLRATYLNKIKLNRDILAEWQRYFALAETTHGPEVTPNRAKTGPLSETDLFRDKLKRVLEISLQMNETHEAELLLNYIIDEVIELTRAERGCLVLVDEAGRMDFRVTRGMPEAESENRRPRVPISYSLIGAVAQTRQPILLTDALTDERFGRQNSVLVLNLRSVLCVPLVARSELIGMIYVDHRARVGRFTSADVDLLTIFASQAATAIENTRLYEETLKTKNEIEEWARNLEQRVAERTAELRQANTLMMRRAADLETSSQVGQQVTSILDLNDLLSQVVMFIQVRFGYYFVGIWMVTDARDAVALRAGMGRMGENFENYRVALDIPSIIGSVCKTGQSYAASDVAADPAYKAVEILPNTRSELALPLRMGEQIFGALDIQHDQRLEFGPDDRIALQILADQISVAIRNAQLYQVEQHRRHLAESLEQAGRELAISLDLREVPGRILEQLDAVVPFERGAVLLQEGEQLRIVARRGFPESHERDELRVPIRAGDVFQQVSVARRPVVIDDTTQTPGWRQVEGLPLNKAWVGIPLVAKDRVIGMISLTRREAAAFSVQDGTLASAFSSQAAIALENARLYEEIRQFNEHLEQMVQARTEELNKAYKTLEKMDKTKSNFIEVAAHELRTPITVIRGYTQVLGAMGGSSNDQTKPLLEGIVSGVDRLHQIVNSMLDVTKIDSQTLKLHKEPTIVSYFVERTRAAFAAALKERKLSLTIASLDTLPLIHADGDLMYKVFYQVVVNAIKYTPDGGSISVTGQAITMPDGAPGVEVVITDTGIGINHDHHEMIFEKFYQTGEVAVHSSGFTKFKGGGPGLGLAIARGIVLAHGGKIWVESVGHDEQNFPGSQFHIVLPVGEK